MVIVRVKVETIPAVVVSSDLYNKMITVNLCSLLDLEKTLKIDQGNSLKGSDLTLYRYDLEQAAVLGRP